MQRNPLLAPRWFLIFLYAPCARTRHASAATISKPVIVAYVRKMNAQYVHPSRSAAIGSTFVARQAGI